MREPDNKNFIKRAINEAVGRRSRSERERRESANGPRHARTKTEDECEWRETRDRGDGGADTRAAGRRSGEPGARDALGRPPPSQTKSGRRAVRTPRRALSRVPVPLSLSSSSAACRFNRAEIATFSSGHVPLNEGRECESLLRDRCAPLSPLSLSPGPSARRPCVTFRPRFVGGRACCSASGPRRTGAASVAAAARARMRTGASEGRAQSRVVRVPATAAGVQP